MAIYEKIFNLFKVRIKDDCDKETTRKLLSPILMFMDLYEKERSADLIHEIFQQAFIEFQWFYWTSDEYYGGIGEWREFPPVCISQLNKAVREKKTSIQILLSQRNYVVDFNEMTKRLIQDNAASTHYGQYSSPVFAKAKLMDEFNIDEFRTRLDSLTEKEERHCVIVKGIIKLLQSSSLTPLDSELACYALTLLLRLIINKNMAVDFIENDGITTLMQLRCNQTLDNKTSHTLVNTLIFLILRKCIDSDDIVLKNAFDQMLINTCNGSPISLLEERSRRHGLRAKRYKSDPKRVFRLIAPMAAIYPSIFIEQIKNKLEIKKGELKIKDKIDLKSDETTLDNSNLKKVIQSTIDQLQRSLNKDLLIENSIFHTSNLLKFIAELVRSYPQASSIFVHMMLNEQSIVGWLIDKLLLNYNKEDKNAQEIASSTKSVLSGLIGDHSTTIVVDHVIEDIKNLLFANIEEYNKAVCQVISLSDKTKLAIKFADRLIVITQLLSLLRDAAGQCNTLTPGDSTKQMILLVKSMSKNNIFNILVKSIWNLPFQEPQGFEAVNTLLKLFESVVGKDVNRFALSRNSTSIREEPRQNINNRTTGIEQQNNQNSNPTMDIDIGSSNSVENEPIVDRIERNADLDSIFTLSNAHRIGHQEEDERDDEDEGRNHQNIEDNEQEDDASSTQSDEEDDDMDTAEEMEAAQAEVAAEEEATEEDMEEDDDDRNSVNMIVGAEGNAERVTNQNFGGDGPDEIDDDDEEEDDEEWDDDGDNNGGDTVVEFEDAMADYLDVADFSDISNELNSMRQSIHRLNVEFSNAFASHQFQQVERTYQAFMQQIPRHFRALISHPRGGGAVLRIRNHGAHNLARGNHNITSSPIRIGIARGGGIGGEQIFGQLINQMAGWPPSTVTAGGDTTVTAQASIVTPYFVDRLLDLCRITDPHSMFLIGILVASHVANEIFVKEEEKSATDEKEKTAADAPSNKEQQTSENVEPQQPVVEDHPMQQIEDSVEGNDEQMTTQSNEPIEVVVQANIEILPSTENQEPEQIETQQSVVAPENTTAAVDTTPTVNLPEGVDPAFLAALPEEMRQEVIRDHLIQQQMNAATNSTSQLTAENDLPAGRLAALTGMEVPEGMDPAFLAALPEDIFQEVVRDHQRQQELARHRRAQADVSSNLRHHRHHHHHRHFAMPHLFRGHHGIIRSGITSNSNPSNQAAMATLPNGGSTLQLFDSQSICTLLLLYLLDQEKFNIVRLQKLLRSICLHPGSCDFTIWALLSMLDGLQNFGQIECFQSEKSHIGWINNLRSGASLAKNERLIKITPNSIQINQQIKQQASNHIVDTLSHLSQRYATHFMPKSVRGGTNDLNNKIEQPPNLTIFWSILRSINSSNPEQMLGTKSEALNDIIAETLETSPFAFVVKLVHSQLPIADKIIKTTSLLSQRLPGNFCEKVSEETRKWIGQEMNALTNILLEKHTNEALRDGRALIAQLLSVFPDERISIMSTLHKCILKSGNELKEQLGILQKQINNVKKN